MGKRTKRARRTSRNESLLKTVRQAVMDSVRAAVAHDGRTDPAELEAVVRLCMIGAMPTGKEDPKALLRGLSDVTINRMASRFRSMSTDPVVGPVSQLFFMEWCHRHGHLNADWVWQWDTHNEGHVKFSAKEPLDKLLEHVERMC